MLSNISFARACVALFALNACSNDDAFDAPPPPVAADGGTGDASSRWSFSSSLVLIIVSLLNALETALCASADFCAQSGTRSKNRLFL